MNTEDMKQIEERRLIFTPAEYPSNAPILSHPFSQWLINRHRKEGVIRGEDYELQCEWLESIGYDKDKHRITKEALDGLDCCIQLVHIHWRHIVYQHTFEELFEVIPTPADANILRNRDIVTRRFPLYRDGKWLWVRFTDRMWAIVDSATFIFRVCPKNLYLNIDSIGDKEVVSLRYQTILGSRLLATLKDAD